MAENIAKLSVAALPEHDAQITTGNPHEVNHLGIGFAGRDCLALAACSEGRCPRIFAAASFSGCYGVEKQVRFTPNPIQGSFQVLKTLPGLLFEA